MMNQMVDLRADPSSDAQLVAACLSGDRQAFAHIVERYQGLLCSLAYSATGDLGRSEDLAQETFVTAWQRLRELREPAKLRAWLCGIGRNLIHNSLRRSRRDATANAEPLELLTEQPTPEPAPAEQAISREEEAILWRSLERIPELYREPLILFYREHQSVQSVAEALELSEDAAKQRLSRGRKLLQEQVAAFVEGALARSVPGKAFTLAVLAALPALEVSAAAATVAGTVAKGTAAAKSASALGVLGAVLGPVLGLLGGYLGARLSIESTRSPRERQFVVKMSWLTAGLAIGFLLALGALLISAKSLLAGRPSLFAGLLATVILIYTASITILNFWTNRRQKEIRAQECPMPGATDQQAAASAAALGKRGTPFEYKTKLSLLGLPLVHVRFGQSPASPQQTAKGWIAIGDVSFGVLFAAGGVAVGGIAVGGLALGLLSIAGMALGALAFGGVAVGGFATGGAAFGWTAAFGGLAAAHRYAVGGQAIAQHANDEIARSFFAQHAFFTISKAVMDHALWLMLVPFAVLCWGWRRLTKLRQANAALGARH